MDRLLRSAAAVCRPSSAASTWQGGGAAGWGLDGLDALDGLERHLVAARAGKQRPPLPAAYGDLSQDPDVLRYDQSRKRKNKKANQNTVSAKIQKNMAKNLAQNNFNKNQSKQGKKMQNRMKNWAQNKIENEVQSKMKNKGQNKMINIVVKQNINKATGQHSKEVVSQKKLKRKEQRILCKVPAASRNTVAEKRADLRTILNKKRKAQVVDCAPQPAKTSRVDTGDGLEVEVQETVTSSGSPRPRSRSSSTTSIEEIAVVKKEPNVLAMVDLADSDDEVSEDSDESSSSSSDSCEGDDATEDEDEESEAASAAGGGTAAEGQPTSASTAVDYWRPWGDTDRGGPSDTHSNGKQSDKVDPVMQCPAFSPNPRPALMPTPFPAPTTTYSMGQGPSTPWKPECFQMSPLTSHCSPTPMSQDPSASRSCSQPEGGLTAAIPQQPSLPKAADLWALHAETWDKNKDCKTQAFNGRAVVQYGKGFSNPFNVTISQTSLNPEGDQRYRRSEMEVPPVFREPWLLPTPIVHLPTGERTKWKRHYLNPFAHAWDPAVADMLSKKYTKKGKR